MQISYYLADQNPHRDRSLGISGYTIDLLRALQKNGGLDLCYLGSRSSIQVADIPHKTLPFRTDNAAGRLIGDHAHGPFLPKADIYHYPKGFLPLLAKRRPSVVTVHDTILQHYADHYPEHRSPTAYKYWIGLLKHSVQHANAIVTVSQFVARDLAAFCERYRIKCPPIFVSYEGADGEADAGQSWPKEDYVLAFASTHPHKQTRRLLELWSTIVKSSDLPRLHLVGTLGAREREHFEKLPNGTHSSSLPREELRNLIRRARALILPSEIEGFGLPALESIYAGTPIVYVKNTAVEETLGFPNAGGFTLNDSDSFREALTQTLDTPQEVVTASALRLKAQYAWCQVALRTASAYEAIL